MFTVFRQYIFYAVAVVIVSLAVLLGVQTLRLSAKDAVIEKNKIELKRLNEIMQSQKKTIQQYEMNAKKAKQLEANQQKIETDMAEIERRIYEMNKNKCMVNDDEKIFNDVSSLFNRGVR